MSIRWMAVLTGFIADTLLSFLLSILLSNAVSPAFSVSPDLAQPADLVLICLLTLSTGVGGYIAGRMAPLNRALHGLLVGVVGILVNEIETLSGGSSIPRAFVIASGVSCLIGGLGGFLSRYPARDRAPPSG